MKRLYKQTGLASLAEKLSENNDRMVEYMAQVRDAIHVINDTNVLHKRSLESNTEVIKEMVESNGSLIAFIRWVFVALVVAIIFLAGAEKALRFIP